MTLPQARLLADFPAFFRVSGEVVVIVGGGEEALNKARLVAQTSARLRIVAEDIETHLIDFIASHGAEHVAEAFAPHHLDGAKLVFVATGDEALDREVAAAAKARKIPVNVVDRPALCDFLTPAIVNRAPVLIAIGSEGAAPVLAQMVRARIDAALSPRLGDLARLAESFRPVVERMLPKGLARRDFWRGFLSGPVAHAVENGDDRQARNAAARLIEAPRDLAGHVWLVDAGPGAEDLMTLRAQRVLMEADVIVHDAGVPEPIVAMGRRDAERLAAGRDRDETARLLVRLGREGRRVVRLRAGAALASELHVLSAAGIGHAVVPGVVAELPPAALRAVPVAA